MATSGRTRQSRGLKVVERPTAISILRMVLATAIPMVSGMALTSLYVYLFKACPACCPCVSQQQTDTQPSAEEMSKLRLDLDQAREEQGRTQKLLEEITLDRDELQAASLNSKVEQKCPQTNCKCPLCPGAACDQQALAPCNALSRTIGKLRHGEATDSAALAGCSQAVVDLTFILLNTTKADATAVMRGMEEALKFPFLYSIIKGDLMKAVKECDRTGPAISAGLGSSFQGFGPQCTASADEIAAYLNYTAREVCPEDWLLVQHLLVDHNCHSLPRRRCFAPNWTDYQEPLPLPESLWSEEALMNSDVRWRQHHCKNFSCLVSEDGAPFDCPDCFDLNKDKDKFFAGNKGMIGLREALRRVKAHNSTLRIGLDLGGGTGTFAALMAENNVTIVTAGVDMEKGRGGEAQAELSQLGQQTGHGTPYMETIALRGLIPLHIPHTARLPFFDSTLDVVHSGGSIDGMDLSDFEDAVFDIDRVLRPGGLMWFSAFHSHIKNMSKYKKVVDLLGYTNIFRKVSYKDEDKLHVYFNLIARKPYNRVLVATRR